MHKKICIWYKNEKFLKLIKSFFSDLRICEKKLLIDAPCEFEADLTIIANPEDFHNISTDLNCKNSNYMKIDTDSLGKLKNLSVFHKLNENSDFLIKQTADLLLERSSELSIFEIPDLLQLLSTERKTLALKIIGVHQVGIIAFDKGEMVYARVDALSGEVFGEEAVYHILSWKQPAVWSFPFPEHITPNIESNLTFVLMDAMRYLDELQVSGKTLECISMNIKKYLELVKISGVNMIMVTDEKKVVDKWFDEKKYNAEQLDKISGNLIGFFNSCKTLAQTFFANEEFLTIDYDSSFVFVAVGQKYNIFFILNKTKRIFLVKMVLLKMVKELQL
jgi:Domain of unknown function (DUF4388)